MPDPNQLAGDWPVRAACRSADPALFTSADPTQDEIDTATAICRGCPVQQKCLLWALRNGEPAGIWGGATPEERRKLLRIAPEGAPNSARRGHRVELTQVQIDTILWRLDHGAHYIEVEADLCVGRAVCRRVWRAHRDARIPPGRRARNERKSVLRSNNTTEEVAS